MANSWLRLWHDMPNDPKWRTIAKASGQSIALVQAVYLQLLVSASQNPVTDETGVTLHVVTVTNEDISSALDVTERNVSSVMEAMQGRVLDGNTLSGWDKRQAAVSNGRNPGKPAKTGAQRAREFRERQKNKDNTVTNNNVTSSLRNTVTTQIRKEEIREEDKEIKDPPLIPPPGKGSAKSEYSPEFEAAWSEYPKRAGGNSKQAAFKAWNARIKSGIAPQDMIDGAVRYAAYMQATGKVNTEFVQQAATFFGPSCHFENEWLIPNQAQYGGRNVNQISPPDSAIPPGFRG